MTKQRVVHYLNQFFAGIGGEEHANVAVQHLAGPVGPGRLLQSLLGTWGEIVGTVVAGDNFFAENQDAALTEALAIIEKLRPDALVVGPAFDAGRYGLACAALSRAATERFGIPVVGGMHPDNPGVTFGRRSMYIVPTGRSAAEMPATLRRITGLLPRITSGESLGPAAEEGYLPRGVRRAIQHSRPASQRAVDMLVERLASRPWQTEIPVFAYDDVSPRPPISDLGHVQIGLVTSGGLVPRGNPDRQVSGGARQCFRYFIGDVESLMVADWESVHGGFSTTVLNTRNPNYALPVKTVRELADEGVIAGVYPYFYSTVGNGTDVLAAKRMAEEIARDFIANGVGAVLLVAT
jgi:glycine reductase complex component B subunit gamma